MKEKTNKIILGSLLFSGLFLFLSLEADELALQSGLKLEGYVSAENAKTLDLIVMDKEGNFQKRRVTKKQIISRRKKKSQAEFLVKKLEALHPKVTEDYHDLALFCHRKKMNTLAKKLWGHVILEDNILRGESCAYLASLTEDVEKRYYLWQMALWYNPKNEKILKEYKKSAQSFGGVIEDRREQVILFLSRLLQREYLAAYQIRKNIPRSTFLWKRFSTSYQEEVLYLGEISGMLANKLLGMGDVCSRCQGSKVINCTKCRGEGSIACPSCRGSKFHRVSINGKNSNISCVVCREQGIISCPTCRYRSSSGKLTCPTCFGLGVKESYETRRQNPICSSCQNKKIDICRRCQGQGFHLCSTCSGKGKVRRFSKGVANYVDCETCRSLGILACSQCPVKVGGFSSIQIGQGWSDCHRCEGKGRFYNKTGSQNDLDNVNSELRSLLAKLEEEKRFQDSSSIAQLELIKETNTLPDIKTWWPAENKIVFHNGRWISQRSKKALSPHSPPVHIPSLSRIKKQAKNLQVGDWLGYFQRLDSSVRRDDEKIYRTTFFPSRKSEKSFWSLEKTGFRFIFSHLHSDQLDIEIKANSTLSENDFKKRGWEKKSQAQITLYYKIKKIRWAYKKKETLLGVQAEIDIVILAAEWQERGKTSTYLGKALPKVMEKK